jgi:APA family basic amino acid/polyamine antiporter
MRMSSDGMLPDRLGRVSERFETPTAATVVCAVAGAAVAAMLPIDVLGDLVSIGTLLSFTIVCAGVLVLRRSRPDLDRPFRVKGVWVVAPVGIVFAVALMATLPAATWIRLAVWLAIGLCIYFLYARRRTGERMQRLATAEAAHPGPVA